MNYTLNLSVTECKQRLIDLHLNDRPKGMLHRFTTLVQVVEHTDDELKMVLRRKDNFDMRSMRPTYAEVEVYVTPIDFDRSDVYLYFTKYPLALTSTVAITMLMTCMLSAMSINVLAILGPIALLYVSYAVSVAVQQRQVLRTEIENALLKRHESQ